MVSLESNITNKTIKKLTTLKEEKRWFQNGALGNPSIKYFYQETNTAVIYSEMKRQGWKPDQKFHKLSKKTTFQIASHLSGSMQWIGIANQQAEMIDFP